MRRSKLRRMTAALLLVIPALFLGGCDSGPGPGPTQPEIGPPPDLPASISSNQTADPDSLSAANRH